MSFETRPANYLSLFLFSQKESRAPDPNEDVDGVPLDDEDVDGIPLE